MKVKKDYDKRIKSIYGKTGEGRILSTGDFQCPASGWGCEISWDLHTGMMWAEVCDNGVWDIEDKVSFDEETAEYTYKWCYDFGIKTADDEDVANEILRNALGEEAGYYLFSFM
ncbi:hypothetical protein [Gudongella sp. DL1XJH-153]|uniref:hypothetical protein n=1 Tax=Gudongella sp. DL1XJH-153 TaxID=3409804 RepID=UPI003BB6507F